MAVDKAQEEARAISRTRPVSQKIHQRIADRFGDAVTLVDAVDPYTVVNDPTRFLEVMRFLRDDPDLRFDFLRSVTGVDYPEQKKIASVYHLYSYDKAHAHVVKLMCDREAPEAPTVEGLWPTANWFEREQYDLLGIVYLSHSDLRRIMLPDDWVGHPLRKDYVEEADYHGIGTTRASPLEAFKQMDDARKKAREAAGVVDKPLQSPVKPPEGWVPPKKKGAAAAAADDGEEAEE
jgi:NADH-quinone oxidoreductase subunit C